MSDSVQVASEFERDLAVLLYRYDLDRYTGVPPEPLARKVVEYIEIVRAAERDAALLSRMPLPIIRQVAADDRCACGWSDAPHLRSEHEPETVTPLED